MIALDTKVLVRFLVKDDPAQHERANRLIERAIARKELLFLSDVVLCECVWVLGSVYRVPRAEIAEILARLLGADHLEFPNPDGLVRARDAFARGRGDFADYVIREQARAAGFQEVATFDRALLKEPGFVAPDSSPR